MKDVVAVAEVAHSGRCLCGAVRFSVEGPLRPVVACHCESCRRGSGHFVAATSAPRERVRVSGAPRWYRVGEHARRGFCSNCGAFLFWDDRRRGTLSILAGSLDQPSGLHTESHVFVAEKADYYEIGDGIPQFEGFDDAEVERSA